MPDEDPNEDSLHPLDELERDALYLLTQPEEGQPLWSVEDIGRELETDEASTFVRALRRAGLVNITSDGFVFATRAGVRVTQLVGHAL
jgi:Mn-dependent DtxR family transcriptional regulator